MSGPRIGIFLPRMSRYGGVEGFGWRLSQALAQAGYSVDYVCARQETEAPQGVELVTLGRFGVSRVQKMLAFTAMSEWKRRQKQYELTIGLGKTLHQDIVRVGGGPLDVFWNLSKRAYKPGLPRQWKMLRRRLAPANWATRVIETKALCEAKRIVVNSHKVREWLLKAHPELDENKISLIYNQPDTKRFAPCTREHQREVRATFGLEPQHVVLSTAATNFALKGTGTLIKALSMLPDTYHLLVAGGRNPKKYVSLAEKMDVSHRVRFLGRVDTMANVYHASDVFVLPSFYDACANAVLEARACGVEAVSTVDNGSSYFLSPERVVQDASNVEELAVKIQSAAMSGNKGGFSWPDNVLSGLGPYLDIVADVLKEKAQSD